MSNWAYCRRRIATPVLLATIAFAASCTSVCSSVPRAQASLDQLLPGEYILTVWSSEGSKVNATAVGRLWLRTREHPDSEGISLYGFTSIDLLTVGAPMAEGGGQSPMSTDPAAPGVALTNGDFAHDYPKRTPVLLVGTVQNEPQPVERMPDGSEILLVSTDGYGIGMWVHKITADGFVGRWSEWGLAVDGKGTFCARRVRRDAGQPLVQAGAPKAARR